MGLESTRTSSPRYLILALVICIVIFAYNYWTEATTSSELLVLYEASNKTIDDLTNKLKTAEEEKTKATAGAAVAEKTLTDKAAADAKTAADAIAKLTAEKTDLDTKLKAEQASTATKLLECVTSCDNKIKEAKAECPTRPREGASLPAAAPLVPATQ